MPLSFGTAVLIAVAVVVSGCATGKDLQATSDTLTAKADTVRAALESQIEQLTKAQRQIEGRQASLKVRLQEMQEEILSAMEDRFDRRQRVIEGQMENQSGQVAVWLDNTEKKLTKRVDDHGTKVQTLEEKLATVDKRVETLEISTAKVQDLLTAVGKHLDGRVLQQEQRLETIEQHGKAVQDRLKKLETQTSAHAGRIGEETAKAEALLKQLESEAQAVRTHLNAVTQSVMALAASMEAMQAKMSGTGKPERVETLARTLDMVVVTVNETTRSLRELKQQLDLALMKLASRVDDQGQTLNQVMQQVRLRPSGKDSAPTPEAGPPAASPH